MILIINLEISCENQETTIKARLQISVASLKPISSNQSKHFIISSLVVYADTVHTTTDNVMVVYCVELGDVITTGTV